MNALPIYYLLVVHFFSERYHGSIQLVRRGKLAELHWESRECPDVRFLGCNRVDVHRGEAPSFGYVSGDNLNPVRSYVVLRGRSIPDGVYAYDASGKSDAPDVEGQLVRIAGKESIRRIVAAFPDRDVVEDAPLLYLFIGCLERSVWRYREAAYAQVMQDAGACAASVLLHAKSRGAKVFALGGFVDDEIAVALNLSVTEVPLAALAVYPEYSETAFNSVDEGVGETAYSNHGEIGAAGEWEGLSVAECAPGGGVYGTPGRYPSLFMLQNRRECIVDLSGCIRIRRLSAQALPGDEFPLTPAMYEATQYLGKLAGMEPVVPSFRPFRKAGLDLDDFSGLLRWLEVGQIHLFGAGLLKIWVIAFDVMFVYPGVYRYVPVRKSIYMQSGAVNEKRFAKCHAAPEEAENTAFALVLTADLNESCNLLGERAYRYMNLNAGYVVQSLALSSRIIRKTSRSERFYFHDELRNLCGLPENESIVAEILVGKA